MTERFVPLAALDPVLAEKLAAIMKRCEARRAEIKRGLVDHLNETASSDDYIEVKAALLEMACELSLDTDDGKDALDLIQRAFRRTVQKRRGRLQ